MKTKNTLIKLSLAIATAAAIAGCSTKPWDVSARQDQNIASIDQTSTGFDTFGRKWGETPPSQTTVAAEPAAAPAGSPTFRTCTTEIRTGLIHLSKKVPAEAALGQEYVSELNATATACAGDVIITDHIPAGASYVKSEPAATVDGNTLTWKFADMEAGQAQNIKVWLKADQEGTLASCASVIATPRVCAATFVGKPALAIEKTGPETALLGSNVTYKIVVKNTGNAIAKNVVVTDPVPDGLSGEAVTVPIGDLAPGAAKAISVTFKADKRGKACNDATANSDNAGKVTAEACTVVQQPGLKIEKTGTTDQIIGRHADYQIVVSNTGDTTIENVTVTDTAPEGTTLTAAEGATISGSKATWTIASLAAGDKQTFAVKLTGTTGGQHCNTATATSGGLSENAQACTIWKGVAGVLLEMVDDPDPILVGESSTYTIKVTNQGFADIHNVGMTAQFGDEIDPVSTPEGTINGKSVTFPVVPVLEPKKVATYTVVGKGLKPGDHRAKVILTCDEIKSPVTKEESTTVY